MMNPSLIGPEERITKPISATLPKLPEPFLPRENILDHLAQLLHGDANVILLEGGPGVGKTTFLGWLSRQWCANSVSFFFKPGAAKVNDLSFFCLDLINQIRAILKVDLILDQSEATSVSLITHLSSLSKKFPGKSFNVVVDGLDYLAEPERSELLEVIPFGLSSVIYILSGVPAETLRKYERRIKCHAITNFSVPETAAFLRQLDLKEKNQYELYRATQGRPNDLSFVLETLRQGQDPEGLLEKLETNNVDQIEWESADMVELDKEQELMLALMVFHDVLSVTLLCEHLNIPAQRVKELLSDFTFVEVENDSITVKSDYFVSQLKKSLVHVKKKAESLHTGFLVPVDSPWLKAKLAKTYLTSDKYSEAVEVLSQELFTTMIEKSDSYGSVLQCLYLGLDASRKLENIVDAFRFSVTASTLEERKFLDPWKSKVEALVCLGQGHKALSLAQSISKREERLKLIASLGRAMHENGTALPSELYTQVENLIGNLPSELNPEEFVRVAEDLLYFKPDSAFEILRLAENAEEPALSEWRLSESENTGSPQRAVSETAHRLASHDTKLRKKFGRAFLSRLDADGLLQYSDGIKNSSARLFILKNWCQIHSKLDTGFKVSEAGIDLLIRSTEVIPNASDLRKLAEPIPRAPLGRRQSLVKRFDAQLDTVKEIGPSLDYIRTRLILAEAVLAIDFQETKERLIECLVVADGIEPLETRTACLAWLAYTLDKIDQNQALERAEKLHTTTREYLTHWMDTVLNTGAEHFQALKDAIGALAKFDPTSAVGIAMKMNIEVRRDLALLHIARSSALECDFRRRTTIIEAVVGKIRDSEVKDQAICWFLRTLALRTQGTLEELSEILDLAKRLESPPLCCRVLCNELREIVRRLNGLDEAAFLNWLGLFKDRWNTLDDHGQKIDLGYEMVISCGQVDAERAHILFDETEGFELDNIFAGAKASSVYYTAILLAIRSFSSLTTYGTISADDFERLTGAIEEVRSLEVRAHLASYLSACCFYRGKPELCAVVNRRIVAPILEGSEGRLFQNVFVASASAQYLAHSGSFFSSLAKLEDTKRDEALGAVLKMIIKGAPHIEPIQSHKGGSPIRQLTYEELHDVLEITRYSTDDSQIYGAVESVVSIATWRKHNKDYTRSQVAQLGQLIQEIEEQQLPSSRNIEHEGFKLALSAQRLRLSRETNLQEWQKLVSEASNITNVSDQVYVKLLIAEALSTLNKTKPAKFASKLLNEIESDAKEIPVLLDRICRLRAIAESELCHQHKKAGPLASEALKMSAGLAQNSIVKRESRLLIDILYSLDEDLDFLARQLDDDPARQKSAVLVRKQSEILSLEKRFKESPAESGIEADSLPAVLWRRLGRLNANRITSLRHKELLDSICKGAALQLNNAYPIFSFALECLRLKYAGSKDKAADRFLRPVFKVLIDNLDFVRAVSSRNSESNRIVSDTSDFLGKNVAIGVGSGDEAVLALRNWLGDVNPSRITIIDGYFTTSELWLLKVILEVDPSIEIHVLASHKASNGFTTKNEIREAFEYEWQKISDEDPPLTKIVIATIGTTGKPPFHDRWILSETSGLRIGTSWNGIGRRCSEVSQMALHERNKIMQMMEGFLRRKPQFVEDEPVEYLQFSLA